MEKNIQIDILVPARNEAENFPNLLSRIHNSLSKSKINYRVIVIDDHSTDDSAQVLKKLSTQYPLLVVKKTGPSGKAFALLEGFKHSTAPIVCMLDADLEYPPEAIPGMYSQIDKHGVVVANRVSNHKSILRKIASKANRFVIGRLLLGLSCDVQSGLKVFKREVMEYLDTSLVKAWAIDIPLLHTARELGLTVGTVNIDFIPRVIGLSKCKAELGRAVKEIALGAIRVKLSKRRMHLIKSTHSHNTIGAGVIHKGERFITHTNLQHQNSAMQTLFTNQKIILLSLLAIFVAGIILSPLNTAIIFIGILSVIYFADSVFSLFVVLRSLHFPPERSFSKSELAKIKDSELPIYSILCPLYKEKEIITHFVENMNSLNWPKEKLDVLLLLEENDPETIDLARSLNLPSYVSIIVVPHSKPKTKPKACNYGLNFIKGEYVVIYDAEDRPDPDQLKKAYLGFKKSSENTVCLQAKLNYFNPHQNLLTRFFTAEYSLWFDVVLPGLQSISTIIPLGGTSNHFKSKVIKELQGWDSFNVTEDCDLGCRLFKQGFTTGLIDSVTLEEANSNVGNWLRQRSRWIKGYLQTYLVHNRDWFHLLKTRGIHAFIFHLVIGLRITFMVINPILWVTTILYFAIYPIVGPTIEALYPSWILYFAVFSLVFGNFLYLYYYMIGAAKRGHWEIIKFIFTVPAYWLLVSIAAVKAFYQLVTKPHFWEKTHHGLHLNLSPKKSFIRPLVKISTPNLVVKLPKKLTTASWFSGGILVVSSGLAFFCNFLYNAYLSRKSTVSFSEFGLIGLVTSFNYILQIPIGALGKTVSYRSAYLLGKHGSSIKQFWSFIRNRAFIVSLGFLLAWLLLTPFLSRVFQTNGILPLLLYSPGWLIFTLAAVDNGYLSGSHRFKVLGLLAIVEAVSKLLLTILVVETGNINLIYAVVPVSAGLAFLMGWIAATKGNHLLVSGEDLSQAKYFPTKYFTTSIFTKLSSLTFLSVDVLAVKIFLSPQAAGQYVLVSIIGKIVYFASSLFNQFITPVVSRAEGAGSDSKSKFKQIMLLSVSTGFVGFVTIGLFGKYITPLLFGSKASEIAIYLPEYTLAMVFFSIAAAIVEYHQAKRHYEFSIFGFVLSPLLVIGLGIFPKDVSTAVNVVVAVSGIYLAGVLVMHTLYGQIKILRNNLQSLSDLFGKPFRRKQLDPEKLRILIFNWYDIKHVWAGGAELYIHNIAKEWVKAGHSVTMFTGNDLHNPRTETVDGIRVVRRGGLFTVAIWGAVYYLLKFRGKFDVIVDIPKGVPFFTPLFVNKPIVCLIHQVHQEMFRAELKFPFKQISCFLEGTLMPLLYKKTQIVAVSESTKKAVIDLGLGKTSEIQIVVPGVDINPTKDAKTKQPSLIYLGRLRPYKSVDLLLKAAAGLIKKYPNLKVVIAGSGEDENRLKKISEKLHLNSHVQFAGKVTEQEKAKLFTQSWIAIQPSSVEGWGITNIEANLCGTPVVAANSDGLRDSVIDGKTGLLFKTGSAIELQRSIEELLENPQKLKSLSENSKEWGTNFSWKISAEKLMTVISGSINSREQNLPSLAKI